MEGVCDASVPTLIDLCRREISVIQDLHEDADELERTLGIIQSFLGDAQTKSITEAAAKTWLNELEALVFEAENILDKLKFQILSEKINNIDAKERKMEMSSCFPCRSLCFPSRSSRFPCPSSHRRQIALKIKDVNENFKSFFKLAINLGLQRGLEGMASTTTHLPSQTDSFYDEASLISREHHINILIEMLLTPTKEVVSIIPIVGMGGLGKTSLVRKVFNNERIVSHFDQKIWIHVSQDFDAKTLFKKIFVAVGEVYGGESRQLLLMKLQKVLEDKNYLLVLDDVWNENLQNWEYFKRSLLGITSANNKGNAILVTTRNTEIASMVKTVVKIPELNLLSAEDCWSIIKSKASRYGEIIPQDVEDVGRSIAAKCKGLPLAADLVGRVLNGKSYEKWLLIDKNWLSGGVGRDANDISEILQLSFHHLPLPSLKKCFAYCSILPKGHKIPKETLIELLMAEGFLGTSNMENVGENFLQNLVQNSLLQVVESDAHGDATIYSMHDLVHDAAASAFNVCPARYISWSDKYASGRNIPKEKAKWLRALTCGDLDTDTNFSQFGSLYSLYVTGETQGYFAKEVSDSMRELIHLRCLIFENSFPGCLRDWIGELYHLQSLRALSEELPSTLTDLINLRHLHVACNTKLPPHLGKLACLQTLPYFHVRDVDGHRIEELGMLENLKGELEIDGLHNVNDEQEATKACLSQKFGIVKLGLQWDASADERSKDELVLCGLQPNVNLEELTISGFKGNKFPEWISKMAVFVAGGWVELNDMMEVKFENCSKCEKIPAFGHLPRLKYLHLGNLENVKSIDSSFYGTTSTVFRALEKLTLSNMQKLVVWEEVGIRGDVELKIFPRLELLSITECKKLSKLPWKSMRDLKTLRELKLLNLEGLVAGIPNWLRVNNPHLLAPAINVCPKI